MDNQINETIVKGRTFKCLNNDITKNWERISLNDFGTRYSLNFIVAKKKEKRLWKNLFLQKHMMSLMEE